MTGSGKPLLYPEERALDDAAWEQGLTPSRIFAILLPVWQVEVRATVTEGRPYELIDRFLERGILEGGLTSVAELSRFFALDEPLVDRAVRVLSAIGHVAVRDGRLALTELALRSQRDQICYVTTREDRRKMYFDAFSSRPFSRGYYDAGTVTFLTADKAAAATAAHPYPRFLKLTSTHGFRRDALRDLEGRSDRDHYNLPFRVEQPESLGEECVYLPVYLVRAADARRAPRYLVYSQITDTADPELSDLCGSLPEITGLVESETLAVQPGRHDQRISDWLADKGVHGVRAVQTERGFWQVTLPATAFRPSGRVPLSRIGSFVPLGTGVLGVWCEDERIREDAFLRRIDAYVTASRTDVGDWVVRLARRLGLALGTVAEVSALARRAGMGSLAAVLAEHAGS
ncbi:hypothetical protein [Amycolatopsis methanolica]|uniref:hypothetical protein n=1 Tax=Amycolatopsis methanolica TaxID=1814 RepID=UPI0003A19AC9|nr:hypothetical protein [Amycolatopsis methanolica]